jgi:glutamyl-tRNA synthetase
MNSSRRVRVRFAPSPTGPLHIGGVRTALYNYLFAKKNHGDFILRIEDTDQNRLVPGAEQYIIDSLKWVGIQPNEGTGFGDGAFAPYRQSERKETYRQYAEKLLASGHAYYAFDTEEELARLKTANANSKYDAVTRLSLKNSLTLAAEEVNEKLANKEHYVIRIKIPAGEEIIFHDEIRGRVIVNTIEMDDKVLLKSDGMPTYHLANVCDDYVMKISHVIRGEEWLPSAPLHVLLYRYLGWEDVMPKFAHVPLLLKPDGNGKLSKRDGDRLGFPVFPLQWTDPATNDISSGYKQNGYLPEAVINFLAFLGWNPGGTKEIYSLDELVEAFTLERISHGGAKFDFEKAKWFNAEYIKHMDSEALALKVRPMVEEKFGKKDLSFLTAACGLIKDRLVFLNDIVDHYSYIFESPKIYDDAGLSKIKSVKNVLNIDALAHSVNNIEAFTSIEIENEFKNFAATQDIKFGDLMKFIRVSLVGALSGPSVPDLIILLGKDITIERLKNCYSQL